MMMTDVCRTPALQHISFHIQQGLKFTLFSFDAASTSLILCNAASAVLSVLLVW